VAREAFRQQCLYFLPLPQGQGSFRPGFIERELYGAENMRDATELRMSRAPKWSCLKPDNSS
jgi:hypothetical protein